MTKGTDLTKETKARFTEANVRVYNPRLGKFERGRLVGKVIFRDALGETWKSTCQFEIDGGISVEKVEYKLGAWHRMS